ncbi:hypothetical protein [Herbaspirillum rubrisubalbicans]|uniref:Uncharacterized protein n=1 Tax=Herbaspirillum rubrisubalbicans TaxID=80842 RepID=A0AAD0U802_9BURK|nr:hypothetical protein [Herbaspirillum rubrisubalbicans]AYR24393.1 hypothetical protein RC54_11360 [Herbaspirillum rubrisubalbicans]
MTTIIAARFDLQEDAAQAVTALTEAGFAQRHISRFFVNPAGQHDRFALGGDRDKSPGAQDTDSGAVTGVADEAKQDKALRLLRGLGAVDIERSSGTIRDGDWIDFDPLSAPVPLEGPNG